MDCDKISWLQSNYPEAFFFRGAGACQEIPTGSNIHGVPPSVCVAFPLEMLDDVCLAQYMQSCLSKR